MESLSRFPSPLAIMQECFLWEINVRFCQLKAEKHLSVTEYALYYVLSIKKKQGKLKQEARGGS